MTQGIDPDKLAKLLTLSASHLDKTTLSTLADARHKALERKAYSPALAISSGSWIHSLIPHYGHQWLAAGLLVAALLMLAGYWQHVREQQLSELDVAILTDDLPIEIFVD